MALLHGSWIHPALGPWRSEDGLSLYGPPSFFFLWGEIWRSTVTPIPPGSDSSSPHPLGLSAAELADYLRSLHQAKALLLPTALQGVLQGSPKRKRTSPSDSPDAPVRWQAQSVSVLSQWSEAGVRPLHSAATLDEPTDTLCLYPVTIQGLCLNAAVATELLQSIPLNPSLEGEGWIGSDLMFWTHAARWSLDLLVRSKFLPAVAVASQNEDTEGYAYWLPLLDSALDQARMQHLSQQMPLVCRCYQDQSAAPAFPAVDYPSEPQRFLFASLQQLVDQQVRQGLSADLLSANGIQDPLLTGWLTALSRSSGALNLSAEACDRLSSAFHQWTQPIARSLFQQQQFRTAFKLLPPLPSARTWTVSYGLQATDDPDCWVGAETIWQTAAQQLSLQGRVLEQPQETLLAGLGLASKVYPLLEDSLQTRRPVQHGLTPLQAYDFLKTVAWRLEDNGFGVIVPPTLANREGWANRLGLQVRAEVPIQGKAAAITLTSLLNFKWELTIGGQRLSKSEFDRLVALDAPLVEVNGEWVELRPQDVKAAQAFFANRQNQAGLTLEDALKLSTGDTLTLDKLPVVKFEAMGALETLLETLSGNQTLCPIEQPVAFQGTLRPYQALGAGWLAFLEQWNLGACLADDMGLGKTVQLIAFLLDLKAKQQWQGPMLLVCPTSVLGNWEREIKRFAPTLNALLHHGAGRYQKKKLVEAVARYDVVLTSYSLVYRDEVDLGRIQWHGIILDEAQNIKNSEARQSQAVRQLQAKCRIALTGTPLESFKFKK